MELSTRVERRIRLLGNSLGLRSAKVFAIGFNKTGTSSLHALFESLARPSFHGVEWRSCDQAELLRRYDCFSDGIPRDFTRLDREFPRSRFILQVRELAPWVYSRLAHIEREKERGSYRTEATWDNSEESVRGWLVQRNEHHRRVMDYFAARPSDLLVVNYTRDPDSAARVAQFIGHHGPIAKPERNRKPDKPAPAAHREMLAACAADLGLEEADFERDLLCGGLLPESLRGRYPLDTSEFEREALAS